MLYIYICICMYLFDEYAVGMHLLACVESSALTRWLAYDQAWKGPLLFTPRRANSKGQ